MTTMADNKDKKVLNVPHLRFPEFRGEWEEHKLSEYLEFKNGLNPDAKRIGSGLPFISVMDILSEGVINYDNIRGKVDATEKEIECFGVKDGDLLFQRSSETLEDVGRANVYMDNRTAIYGGFVIRGRKIGNYEPLFFKYLLATPLARKKTCRMGAGAQHFNIGQEGLSKISLYFPSIEEQSKIATLLSLIDDRIATQNKIIEDLKLLKSAIIERAYRNHSYHPCRIGDVIEQISEKNKDKSIDTVLSVNNKQGFINQSEQFEDRIIASEDTSNYKIVYKNDFAYNPARINVGSIARLRTIDMGIVSPMYICFRVRKEVVSEYLEYFFSTSYFFYEMQKRLEGSVRQCLSFEGICNIPIYIPSSEEQHTIGKKISVLLDKIDVETLYHCKLVEQKHYLLRQMFI